MGKLLSPWGRRVKKEQIERGWDNQQLADAAKLSPSYCLAIIHGRAISKDAVIKISKAVNIPVPNDPSRANLA